MHARRCTRRAYDGVLFRAIANSARECHRSVVDCDADVRALALHVPLEGSCDRLSNIPGVQARLDFDLVYDVHNACEISDGSMSVLIAKAAVISIAC